MCDTFVALPEHTANGHLIFGKNSDREPNEAQAIVRIPAADSDHKFVRCTYIEIPQVRHTHEVILSKPFQMWGAEMGVNEHGVVIGNEAVFTKFKIRKADDGLTGMDLVRLALERSTTAKNALLTIAELLECHGQDACGGYRNRKFYYHNSFLIADAQTAWVLETAGPHWVAKRVESFASISNGLTIESDFDLVSPDAVGFSVRKGWTFSRHQFRFRQAYSDWLYTKGSNCRIRQANTFELGDSESGRFSVAEAIRILATHDRDDAMFTPDKATTASICMHPTGLANPSQTNGSMIAEIRPRGPATVWLTGTSMPCLSVYVPFFLGDSAGLENPLAAAAWNTPTSNPDASLWWRAERIHRQICRNYPQRSNLLNHHRQRLQSQLIEAEHQLFQTSSALEKRLDFSSDALERRMLQLRSIESEAAWNGRDKTRLSYRYYWNRINRQVGIT